MNLALAIKERFNFEVPSSLSDLADAGRLDSSLPSKNYLWLFDAEWFQPEDIINFQFQAHQKEEFIPFAFTGNGDYWAWWSGKTTNENSPIVICPHDCIEGEYYSPDLNSWFYRRCLDYANGGFDPAEEDNAKQYLLSWTNIFKKYWPSEWNERLRFISSSPLHNECLLASETYASILAEDLNWNLLDKSFYWNKE